MMTRDLDPLGGLSPELVAEIQRVLGSSEAPMAMPAPSAAPAIEEDDASSTWDILTGILSSPFRLVGAAKTGIEDAVGHPNAQARDAQEAQYDMTLKYLLASESIPDNIKRMLPLPQTDRTPYTARQTSTTATATGRDNSTLPAPTPRRTGVLEWLSGEDRRQRARDQATIQAALRLAGYDYDLQKDQAEVRRLTTAGDSNQANALKTDAETQLIYRWGDEKESANIDQSRASAESSRASAASSYATRDATMDRNARENEFYEQVRLPTGLTNLDQRGQTHDLRMRTGEERLRQLQQMGPLNVQAKQAAITRQGGSGDMPKDYLTAVKGINTAVNQARDDARTDSWFYFSDADEREAVDPVYRQFGVPMTDQGEPDWDAYVAKFHAKPTAALPSTSTPTISTRPNGAERFQIYDMLKRKFPNLDDGMISSRADIISEAMPKLDFTSEDTFLDSAEMAGLNDEEMILVWNSRNQ